MLKSFRSIYVSKYILNNAAYFSSKTESPNLGLKKNRRVGDDNIRVTLLQGEHDEISIVSLSEAHKMSKSRNLKLVKIIDLDTKTNRPIYKLMSSSDFFKEEVKKRAEKKEARSKPQIKGEKILQITGTTAQHDIETKLKKLNKWLLKYFEIRVLLTSDGKPFANIEKVFKQIQEGIKEIGIVNQKHAKDSSLKFNIKPNIENIEKLKKEDPNFLKKFDHGSDDAADLDLDEELIIDDDDNQDVVVIDEKLSDAKQSSFIHKS